ncbi:MAG: hypothetical protein ABSC56_12820 [Solirubrobacteraceae bacterium]
MVANQTAASPGLEGAMRARLDGGPARFTVLLPLGRGDEARRTAQHVAARLSDAGFDADARVGDRDPLHAVLDAWNPAEFDEIIVSTLPASTSRWMASGLPRRIERLTGALVRHVETQPVLASERLRAAA